MATVSFLYRSIKEKAALKIRLFFVKEGKNTFVEASLRLIVTKEYWEKFHYAVKLKDISIKNLQTDLNTELNAIENYVLKSFLEMSLKGISKKWLESALNRYYSIDSSGGGGSSFREWSSMYINDKKDNLTEGTRLRFEANAQVVFGYIEISGKELLIKDIGINFKRNFEEYCKSILYSNNTISHYFRYVKSICKYAALNGVEVSNTLNLVALKEREVDNIYLNEEEIGLIENLELSSFVLDNARDWLLISCYTGQRFSDFSRFNGTMIKKLKNKNGIEVSVLEFVQVKTKKRMTIPLSGKVLSILEKRGGKFPKARHLSVYNEYIKKVCEKAGINELCLGSLYTLTEYGYRNVENMYEKWRLVSSHIGRRSFATNNYGKIPTMYLKEMTGHTTEEMFLKYIGKGSGDIALELSEYFELK